MRKKTTIAATLCAVGALALGACSSSSSSSSTAAASSGSSSTLVMESSPSGPVSQDFNPFSSTSADNILGATNMIYDPLMQFDLLKPGVTYPWLATAYTWSNGGRTITFTLRSGVKFTNAHDSYLINLASPDATLRAKSVESFRSELRRCDALGLDALVSHPGNFMDDRADGVAADRRHSL